MHSTFSTAVDTLSPIGFTADTRLTIVQQIQEALVTIPFLPLPTL